MTGARVHRFRDNVAASVGTGPTTYMGAADARALAAALLKVADSIDREPFEKAHGMTTAVPLNPGGWLDRDADGRALSREAGE